MLSSYLSSLKGFCQQEVTLSNKIQPRPEQQQHAFLQCVKHEIHDPALSVQERNTLSAQALIILH